MAGLHLRRSQATQAQAQVIWCGPSQLRDLQIRHDHVARWYLRPPRHVYVSRGALSGRSESHLDSHVPVQCASLELHNVCSQQHVVAGCVAHLRETAIVQYFSDGFAHFQHHVAHSASRLVTILTTLILRAARTWDGCERTVENTNDVPYFDVCWQGADLAIVAACRHFSDRV